MWIENELEGNPLSVNNFTGWWEFGKLLYFFFCILYVFHLDFDRIKVKMLFILKVKYKLVYGL